MIANFWHRNHTVAIATVAATFLQTGTMAQSEDMIFGSSPALNGESCEIQVLRDGTFGVSPNFRALNSQNFGGIGAEIQVTSRKRSQGAAPGPRFRITLEPPASFTTAPPGGDDNVAWRTRFSGVSVSNGVNFNTRNGLNARRLPRTGTSVTLVTGHLRARKPVGELFPTGNYVAIATFRCE
ncbi:MAG: hypothetical protein ACR2O3_02880 [Rhizobiaceae bacterium]